jgi:chromosome segregation ATPase
MFSPINNIMETQIQKVDYLKVDTNKIREGIEHLKFETQMVREGIEQNWERIRALEKDIEEVKKYIKELKESYAETDQRVEKVKEKYAMEKQIMISIVGSRKKIRDYDNIWALFRDPQYKKECEAYLTANSITEDELYDMLEED